MLHLDMSALTILDVLSEQEFLKVSPSPPFCTPHTLMTNRNLRLASNSRYSQMIPRDFYRNRARLGAMLGGKSKLSRRNKRTIYKMCIRTPMTYASPVFAHAAPKALDRLQVIQN
ncbi:hypothetical protein EVAR_28602_1 [Eumeta japonica]|uniref:RNA-directed DNA polymerase from mobile element jockey n=1 Tax=Eumeta variegata TaxID=151549 RepID=A0A4C1UXF0_EUMVA|nr:hypothetical protein EVAR_28602_1 [Eumeta japonica]